MINTGLLNAIYIFEGLQALPLIVIAGWVGYILIGHKKFSQKIKLGLWALFTVDVLVAACVWSLALYNYVHYERPVYRQENMYNSRRR
jgi:hypothetical protein